MLRLKLYYHAKPFLPWSFRMAVRRFFAQRKRHRLQSTWPIDPSTSAPPVNWSGWPDNKHFAFMLSHDVESQVGYDQLEKLLQIEESLGFRSVINFIPEGQYRVSKERLHNLKSRGFEVGVHGLHHDGKLYNNLASFKNRAQRINQYLKSWDATGFRSPLMHRNLDWLHKLNITYDSSSFDTDPFEPQPDGLGTIFPKWIPRPNGEQRPIANSQLLIPDSNGQNTSKGSPISNQQSIISNSTSPDSNPKSQLIHHSPFTIHHSNIASKAGYVELPYTLPQDSTLYLLLKEQTIDIWKNKTAWIAKHGGMAFVNVHPDYIDFNGKGTQSQYPASHYADFLKHVKETYAEQYWHATPKEVASYFLRSSDRRPEARSPRSES